MLGMKRSHQVRHESRGQSRKSRRRLVRRWKAPTLFSFLGVGGGLALGWLVGQAGGGTSIQVAVFCLVAGGSLAAYLARFQAHQNAFALIASAIGLLISLAAGAHWVFG